MANFFCVFVFRILLPAILAISFIFRPSGLSFIYLFFLFYLPFAPVPTTNSMKGHTGYYMKILIAISTLTFLSQIAFQIVLFSFPPYGSIFKNQEFLEQLLRHMGYVRLDEANGVIIVTWISPEILVFVASIVVFIVSNKAVSNKEIGSNEQISSDSLRRPKPTKKPYKFLVSVGRYGVLCTLCLAAVLRPSVIGGLYFLIFLSTATWWGCNKQLGKGFAILMRCLMVVVFAHFSTLYLYQFPFPQEFLAKNSTYARYFGLKPILSIDPTGDPRIFNWSYDEWATCVHPIAIFLLYYCLALESKALLKPQSQKKQGAFSRLEGSFTKVGQRLSQRVPSTRLMRSATTKRRWQSATRKVRGDRNRNRDIVGETTPLIRGVSPSTRRYGSGRRSGSVLQDSTGSVTITGDNPNDIPMEELEDQYKPTVFENIMFALETLLHVINQSSYIGTNIIMMAWSITYLSWITFVLLLWANLLWLIPNQRKSMLRSSPFLVFYAWFLLISAYIYSMDLTEDELPSNIKGINLAQIGFQKITTLPCNPLLVKCLFTVMFWITLRQYMQERLAERQTSALADMVAPLQITVGTAAGVSDEHEQHGSKIMQKIGVRLRRFLTKSWIWVVAITLFAVAITGQQMTGFRIIYMALFLIFVLSFQLSFRAWRRMMFGFWLTVIIYSMIILVMVYTYQFDNFPEYWNDYLHVPPKQQADIGLERFETKQLFVRLVTPTFFVIITVIQLHYFHKDFMELSDPKNTEIVHRDADESSLQGGITATSDKDETLSSSLKFNLSEIGHMTSLHVQEIVELWMKRLHRVMNLTYLFLEIHMPKIVLFFAMLTCVYDKCALYLFIIILISLAFTIGRPVQIFAIYCSSVFISILLLAKMIYQIQYIKPNNWDVSCDYNNSVIENNARWLGFYKTEEKGSMLYLVKWNIIYILIVSLWSVILVRQTNYRISRNKPLKRPFFMFPKITRSDADKDVVRCLKYLANYGFYKFGVEISLMATVALIGFRMDMYSVIYSIWLCILLNLKRENLAKIWNFYMIFIAILLPIQYIMSVGIPPTLCLLYPWDSLYPASKETIAFFKNLQDWAYLMGREHSPSAKKLICDFILLVCVSRQSVVFRIEKRHTNQEYPGGSNDSIIHNAERKGFVNPVPDFISFARTYLDIFKRAIFMSFLWFTLAVVFLAGTYRVNVFSIGYFLGAFVFLWQGTDLFLRPIPKIIKSWNVLMSYNVAVILIKTTLQIIGCVFINYIPSYSCWPIQLFAIGCVRKFDFTPPEETISTTECKVPKEYVGLVWDGLCFGCLVMQRRIFESYNFFHMINETKAATILASRGAELIEELRLKRMNEQVEVEKHVLEKIKTKMERIKANQQKIQGTSYKDTASHFVDTILKGRPKYRKKQPETYKQAIRSGDYYMFDGVDDEDVDLVEEVDERKAAQEEGTDKRTVGEIEEHPIRGHDTDQDISEPQPGTSKDDDITDLTETTTNWKTKIITYIMFVWVFIESAMISLTKSLNRYTSDYRYIIKVLGREKKLLKEYTDYDVGLRLGTNQIWQPAASYHTLLKDSRVPIRQHDLNHIQDVDSDTKALATIPDSSEKDRRKASILSVPEIRILAASMERGLDSPTESGSETGRIEDESTEMSSYDQPAVVQLLLAMWYIIMSQSELLCYFVIFLNQIKTATFLSLPLPLMVFCWGTLTIPRPCKTFWVTIIAYTEVIVLLKCMFQFDIIPWNANQDIIKDPFYAPRIIGVERKHHYGIWDLILLLVVFFHRFMLKSLGLWQTSNIPAALLASGEYKMDSQGQLVPVVSQDTKRRHPIKSLYPVEDPTSSPRHSITQKLKVRFFQSVGSVSSKSKSTPLKSNDNQPSDLQRLVEETDDDDDRKDEQLDVYDNRKIVCVSVEEIEPCSVLPEAIQMATTKYTEPFRLFFKQLIDPTSRVAVDVYSYMFLCDFFNFFVILIGYSSFGTHQGDVSSYLEDNRVPVLFLLMLILQFMLIIIDRGIFLRKNILAKVIFQFIQIVILHVWLFIMFPIITERSFNSVVPPQMYYMVKCFYLLLSAYQIRCGYPTRILGNFLCKGYNYIHMFLFKGFMNVPFLFELRTIMDWMWTDTSMTVFDWIKMEDIFAHIYLLKCTRYIEEEYPQKRGERKNPIVKYAMGGLILAIIIGIIWFPLVFFSLGSAVGEPNPPSDVSLEIRIGPYEPVYQLSAQSNSIFTFSEGQLWDLQQIYIDDKTATSFVSNYDAEDVVAIKLSSYSANIWSISPPDRTRMVNEVNSSQPLTVRLQYKITHRSIKTEDSAIVAETIQITIPGGEQLNPTRQNLLGMLEGDRTVSPVLLEYILPKFIKVTNKGTAKPITQLMKADPVPEADSKRTISLVLNNSVEQNTEWWRINELCDDANQKNYLKKIAFYDCESIILYTFNDKTFPSKLNIITEGGIIGLYTTLVFVASRILKGFFIDQYSKIMFEDLPNVDRILQLCLDIYLVREAREFILEEDLFAKLVFLFRSPETLIKWSRPREELEEDEQDGDDD